MTAAEFRALALDLPEVAEGQHMKLVDFRISKKIFASLNVDECWAMVKLFKDRQAELVSLYPDVFQPFNGAWGKHGYTKMDLSCVTDAQVKQALWAAWCNTAPNQLLQKYADEGPVNIV